MAETRVFRPSVNTGYRLRHFPSRITDFDRPSFCITNQRFLGFSGLSLSVFVVFLGVREHDLPTFPVPIRIVVSTRFHLFPPVLTSCKSIRLVCTHTLTACAVLVPSHPLP